MFLTFMIYFDAALPDRMIETTHIFVIGFGIILGKNTKNDEKTSKYKNQYVLGIYISKSTIVCCSISIFHHRKIVLMLHIVNNLVMFIFIHVTALITIITNVMTPGAETFNIILKYCQNSMEILLSVKLFMIFSKNLL